MERQANYAIVGALSVAILIGALVFIVWLANYQFNQTYDTYRVIFRGPVSGLSKGGEVQFNGIKLGEITSIKLDRDDANRVLTDLRIANGTPVRLDSTAQAVSQGITGVKYIQISPGSRNQPLLRDVSQDSPPVILARRGKMDDIVNDMSKMTASGADALNRVNRVLSNANIGSMSNSLENVSAVTAELKARKAMFADMAAALSKLNHAAGDLQETLAATRTTFGGSDRGALRDLSATTAQLHELVVKLDGPVSELSTSTVPGATVAMDSIERAADRLESLTSRLERNPRALLTDPGSREVEIKP